MACYLVYVIGPDRRDEVLVGMTTSIGDLQRSFSSYPRQFPAECSFPVTRTLQSFALEGAGGYLSQYSVCGPNTNHSRLGMLVRSGTSLLHHTFMKLILGPVLRARVGVDLGEAIQPCPPPCNLSMRSLFNTPLTIVPREQIDACAPLSTL